MYGVIASLKRKEEINDFAEKMYLFFSVTDCLSH